ncbi:MAG: hypothetical protein AAGF48_09245 [Pseudomonadota bacterium]
MQGAVSNASTFAAPLRASISAARSLAAELVSRAGHAARLQWAGLTARIAFQARIVGLRTSILTLRVMRLALRAMELTFSAMRLLRHPRRARAILGRLPGDMVQLTAASAAVVLTLIALALPAGNDGKILASVELALGAKGGGVAGLGAVEIPIEFPTQTAVASSGNTETSSPADASPPAQVAKSSTMAAPPAEPDLAGLAEIPEELNVTSSRDDKDKKGRAVRKPSFAARAETQENLPWKAVEPVMFKPMGPGEQHVSGEAPAAVAALPSPKVSSTDISKWTKGKATKIMGAQRTKPLYHFVVWVEPPQAMQAHVAGVSYDFSSPAIQPQSQASMDRESGFKINAAGLVCAEEILVTLRFDDGRVEKTSIDGCALFNKA